jgi:DNA-binding transcriptional LysR family regulator
MLPTLVAGLGVARLPDFIVADFLADGRLETILDDWAQTSGGLYFVTPPGGPKPARLVALGDFLAKRLSRARGKPAS